jgi:hypothetical protein
VKCRACLGDGSVPAWTRSGYAVCRACNGKGWLPFWTPAERAGLKAMGRLRTELSELAGWNDEEKAVGEAIVRFVAASRKVKEDANG